MCGPTLPQMKGVEFGVSLLPTTNPPTDVRCRVSFRLGDCWSLMGGSPLDSNRDTRSQAKNQDRNREEGNNHWPFSLTAVARP